MKIENIVSICAVSLIIIIIFGFSFVYFKNLGNIQGTAKNFCLEKGYEKLEEGTQTYFACIKYDDNTAIKWRRDIVCENDKCYFYRTE